MQGFAKQRNQILLKFLKIMVIQNISEYVKFFVELNMGSQVTLLSFVNNEKRTLKIKLKNKGIKKEPILDGIKILENLILEIKENGEKFVLEKYFEK